MIIYVLSLSLPIAIPKVQVRLRASCWPKGSDVSQSKSLVNLDIRMGARCDEQRIWTNYDKFKTL